MLLSGCEPYFQKQSLLPESLREAHFPPPLSSYAPPCSDTPDYIGSRLGPQGFGTKDFYVAQVPWQLAVKTIKENHYSHKIVNNSYLHLGVYFNGVFCGVLQYGYALNPCKVNHIVDGTQRGEYLELNRMWIDDVCPRNSESRAISYSLKYIKRALPMVAWIQSFADERCKRLGVVYQACSFLYTDSHEAVFYELDGEVYHKIQITPCRKAVGSSGEYLKANKERAKIIKFRQFRYIHFLKKSWRRRLKLQVLPYPKPEADS